MRLFKHSVALLIITLVFIGASCQGQGPQADRTKALLAFGETLDAAGQSFVSTGKIYNASLDAGAITKEQYQKWAAFARPFQQLYPNAKRSWDLARQSNNVTSMQQVQTEIGPLLAQLATFSLTIYQITAKPVAGK